MALTSTERVQRWREKNRALYNLRRRESRKRRGGTTDEAKAPQPIGDGQRAVDQPPLFATKKVGELRILVMPDHKGESTEVIKPRVFTNDYGAVISESVWKRLQEKKAKAKEGGYVLDEYSQ